MKKIVLFYFLFTCFLSYSQTLNWIKNPAVNTTYDGPIPSIITKDANYLYSTGPFNGTLNISGITLTSENSTDILLAKYDLTGNVVWAIKEGGKGTELSQAITLDLNGNIYVAGKFRDSLKFGTVKLIAEGYYDGFLAKFDNNGNLQWVVKNGRADEADGINGICTDAIGNVYATGYHTSLIQSTYTTRPFLAKYDPNGNVLSNTYLTTGSGFGNAEANAITIDNNNIYVTGNFQGTQYFGSNGLQAKTNVSPGGALTFTEDAFILKADLSGNVVWAKSGGGDEEWLTEEGSAIGVDNGGNIYVTGNIGANSTFESITSKKGGIFLVKYDNAGNLLWLQNPGLGLGKSISVDASGNSYITGISLENNSFACSSSTSSTSSSYDLFLAKYNNEGSLQWSSISGSSIREEGNNVCIDNSGNVYVTGYFDSGSFSFANSTITGQGVFLISLKDPLFGVITPSPTVSSFTPSGVAIDEIISISGSNLSNTKFVKVNGECASFIISNDNTILVTIPEIKSSGTIDISTPGGTVSTPFTLIPKPTITSVFPNSGGANSTVRIGGTNLESATEVRVNGKPANFTILGTYLYVTIPDSTNNGPITVSNNYGTVISSTDFNFIYRPTITTFYPSSTFTDSTITITGNHLKDVTIVNFNGIAGTIKSKTTSQITVMVPTLATTGPITLIGDGGTTISTSNLIVITSPIPVINKIFPTSAGANDTITIYGRNFTSVKSIDFKDSNGIPYGTPYYNYEVKNDSIIKLKINYQTGQIL